MISKSGNVTMIVAIIALLAGMLSSGYFYFQNQKLQLDKSLMQERLANSLINQKHCPGESSITAPKVCPPSHGLEQLKKCSATQCLFKGPEAVEGLGTLSGYFGTHPYNDFDGKTYACDSLIVTGGSPELVNDLLSWVKNGNTVNGMVDDKLVLNLNFSQVSESEKQKIKSSNSSNLVELRVVRVSPQPRDSSTCESFVEIISVK